jgi:hypothetical protein
MRHLFFLKDPSLLATASLLADTAVEGADGGGKRAKVPEFVNVLPEPDKDGKIYSRDNRVLHVDDMEKLAKRSNAMLKKQKGGGLVDRDHETYGGFFVTGGGPAIGWAEEFEYRPGKGMWARTDLLPGGEQSVGNRDYRYTSAVVSGVVEAEVDEEAWSVTWHITPETVDGFAITNIPALVTTSMFSERTPEQRRDELLAVLLKKLGVAPDAGMPEVRDAFTRLTRFTDTSAAEGDPAASSDSPPRNLETPAQPIDGNTPPLKKDDDAEDGEESGGEGQGEEADAAAAPLAPGGAPPEPAPAFTAAAAADAVDYPALLAAANKRIAALETEAGKAFVDGLVHAGKMTPAQRPAALKAASTAEGLANLRELYQHAPPILPTTQARETAAPTAPAPHGLNSKAYQLARQGMPAHEIAAELTRQENNR